MYLIYLPYLPILSINSIYPSMLSVSSIYLHYLHNLSILYILLSNLHNLVSMLSFVPFNKIYCIYPICSIVLSVLSILSTRCGSTTLLPRTNLPHSWYLSDFSLSLLFTLCSILARFAWPIVEQRVFYWMRRLDLGGSRSVATGSGQLSSGSGGGRGWLAVDVGRFSSSRVVHKLFHLLGLLQLVSAPPPVLPNQGLLHENLVLSNGLGLVSPPASTGFWVEPELPPCLGEP